MKAGPTVRPMTYPVEADLAESWTQANDTTYIFKLKKGVRWHNKPPVNGREFTADDTRSFNCSDRRRRGSGRQRQFDWAGSDPKGGQDRQILLDDVSGIRRHRLRIQKGGLRLAQVGLVKPDDPIREGDARPDRRLDQSLQIEGDVVILVPQVRGGVHSRAVLRMRWPRGGKAAPRPDDDAATQA